MTPVRSLMALTCITLSQVQALDIRRVPLVSIRTRDGAEPPVDAAASATAALTVGTGAEAVGGAEAPPANATVPLTDAGAPPLAAAQSGEAQARLSSRGACDNLKWGVLIALAALNVFGFFAKAATGFGENILVQTGWHILALCQVEEGSLLEIVIILTASNIPVVAAQAWLQRRHCNLPLALVLTAFCVPSTVVGVYILYKFQLNVWLKRVLGMLLLFVVLWFLFTEESECCGPTSERSGESKKGLDSHEDGGAAQRLNSGASHEDLGAQQAVHSGGEEPPESKPQTQSQQYDTFGSCGRFWSASFWGFLSGLLGGIFATCGPPLIIFVMCERIPKNEWRGTGALNNLIEMIVRGACLIGFAFMKNGSSNFFPSPCQQGLDILVSIVFGLVGLCLGNCFSDCINAKWFRRILNVFLLVGGISLLCKT